jgi:hypothetical protein
MSDLVANYHRDGFQGLERMCEWLLAGSVDGGEFPNLA